MCGEASVGAEQCSEPETSGYPDRLPTDVQRDDGRPTLVSTAGRRKNQVVKGRRPALERSD